MLGPTAGETLLFAAHEHDRQRPAFQDAIETIHQKLDECHEVVVSKLDSSRAEIVQKLGVVEEKFVVGIDTKDDKALPAIYHHGNKSYSIDGLSPLNVTGEEHNVLTAFAASGTSLDTKALADAGCGNVSRVMKQLIDKFPGAARKNNGKGAGYYIRVLAAPNVPTT